MGTAILRSDDCLQSRFRQEALAFSRYPVRSGRNSSPSPHAYQTRRRKQSQVAVQANQDRDRSRYGGDRSMVAKAPAANLVMGQVKILKRGENLISQNTQREIRVSAENRKMRAKSEEVIDLVLGSSDRFGPDPDTVQKQIRVSEFEDGIYAGFAFVTSPPPSSVPVPGFLGKNGPASSDLRQLLHLHIE